MLPSQTAAKDLDQTAKMANALLRRASLKFSSGEMRIDEYRRYRTQTIQRFANNFENAQDDTVMHYKVTPTAEGGKDRRRKRRDTNNTGRFHFLDFLKPHNNE